MRLTSLGLALCLSSCSAFFDPFRAENPAACTNKPLLCPSDQTCNYKTRQCEPASCRSDGFCWENPRPQLFQPNAMYGTSTGHLFLASRNRLYRFSGSTFVPLLVDLPMNIQALVGAGEEAFLLVGDNGAIHKWNGERLVAEETGTTANLLAAWGNGADNIWVVGDQGAVLHKDENGWNTIPTGTTASLFAITGASSGVYFLGREAGSVKTLHWDGSSVRTETTPIDCMDLAGIGVLQDSPVILGANNCMLKRTNDGTWEKYGGPTTTNKTDSLSLLVSDGTNTYVSGKPGSLFFRTDKTWSSRTLSGMEVAKAMVLLPGNDLWIGGTTLYRVSAGLPNLLPAGHNQTLLSLSGTTDEDMWAVGIGGSVLHRKGNRWETVENGSSVTLNGVYAPTKDAAWVVGFGVLHNCDTKKCVGMWKGAEELTAIHGANANNVWVVGNNGFIGLYDKENGTFINESAPVAAKIGLRSVFAVPSAGAADVLVYAVGENGTVVRRGKNGWTQDSSAPTGSQALNAVFANSASDVWIGGTNGFMARYDGTNWKTYSLNGGNSTEMISGISGSGPQDVWAVTSQGSVYHYQGEQFSLVSSDFPALQSVFAVFGKVYVAGALGTVLRKM